MDRYYRCAIRRKVSGEAVAFLNVGGFSRRYWSFKGLSGIVISPPCESDLQTHMKIRETLAAEPRAAFELDEAAKAAALQLGLHADPYEGTTPVPCEVPPEVIAGQGGGGKKQGDAYTRAF
jgi:hypothetical protein